MSSIFFKNVAPSSHDFVVLREACGWGSISDDLAVMAIRNSLIFTSVYDGDLLIGFGRVIGDGALNYYIQDVIVVEAYQNRGLGTAILTRLMESIETIAHAEATIGLMAASGRESFYRQFGFDARPNDLCGAGMTRNVRNI